LPIWGKTDQTSSKRCVTFSDRWFSIKKQSNGTPARSAVSNFALHGHLIRSTASSLREPLESWGEPAIRTCSHILDQHYERVCVAGLRYCALAQLVLCLIGKGRKRAIIDAKLGGKPALVVVHEGQDALLEGRWLYHCGELVETCG